MTIEKLCIGIELQTEIMEKVISFSETFDFENVREALEGLKSVEKREDARINLENVLGEDEQHIKILSCMLKCATETYELYKEKNIDDKIFFDTMKCFTRFINECNKITGEYAFDREWWTARQVGFRLFRIGELEYELRYREEKPVIGIHIPSDADLSAIQCDSSLKEAKKFFDEIFDEYKGCEYNCHSWLLVPILKQFLPTKSNIAKFQERFEITSVDSEEWGFIEWIYNRKNTEIQMLPENTSLQKKLKEHLLNGGSLGAAFGILRA